LPRRHSGPNARQTSWERWSAPSSWTTARPIVVNLGPGPRRHRLKTDLYHRRVTHHDLTLGRSARSEALADRVAPRR
jgi:hypothetical protein